MIKVPNLIDVNALEFSGMIQNYQLSEGEIFDFSGVHNCDPFPMLVVAGAIRQLRKHSDVKKCSAQECENSYAEHMRFYRAMGIQKGKDFSEDYGNQRYLPITCLKLSDLRELGASNLERIQEVIVTKSKTMANVLSQGNESYKKMLSYALTEIMRNIPEHSQAEAIWYCAQYWPSYDLVELAIMDEGIGIRESLLSNSAYQDVVKSDEEALRYAVSPGISRTFSPGGTNISTDEWANSGYGLYMISHICAELGGSFIIASGDSALKLDEHGIRAYKKPCHVQGTTICLRLRLSHMNDYEEIAKRILNMGEKEAKESGQAIRSASKSTCSILGYDE